MAEWGDTATRVLLAVLTQDRPTVRSVAAEVGRSVTTAHFHLRKLRTAGLVEWDDEKQGTLHATVAPIARVFGYNERADTAVTASAHSPDLDWRPEPMFHRTARLRFVRGGP